MAKTNTTDANDSDIVLDLGLIREHSVFEMYSYYREPLHYNVTRFLREYKSLGPDWHRNINSLLEKLDEKVKIDVKDKIHQPILDGIEYIVDLICSKLKQEGYPIKQVLKTGSLYAGLRVGRPYEADILLELEHGRIIQQDKFAIYFCKAFCNILKKISIKDWIVYGFKERMAGGCVTLIYKGDENGSGPEGVQIDFILVGFNISKECKGNISAAELSGAANKYISSL